MTLVLHGRLLGLGPYTDMPAELANWLAALPVENEDSCLHGCINVQTLSMEDREQLQQSLEFRVQDAPERGLALGSPSRWI